MTLTEQWKKGELEGGMYYIEFKDGVIVKDVYAFGSWGNINEHFLKQVLAPVPSYEEWLQLHKFLEEFNALEVAKENQQLKELLKYCHYYIINTPVYPQGDDAKQVEIHKLSDQIINAIGEK